MQDSCVELIEYNPTAEDSERVGSRLTAYNLGAGGPLYAPIPIGFKAVAWDEAVKEMHIVGELLATGLWGRVNVNLLEVDPAFRGHGIGQKLLAALEAWAEARQFVGIHLWSTPWQGEGFYERSGYQEACRFPLSIPGHFGEKTQFHIIYHKELRAPDP
jgi:GNAT superfamily N-acetyltransferase